METYVNNAACRGVVPSALEKTPMKSRRFLIAKLLSARNDARLIVAPAGFGKTFLAAQYASLVFSFWHVFWFDCQDLRFLRALNEGTLDALILQRDSEVSLVVFDDVPLLSAAQAAVLEKCVSALRARGCEVLACATPACAAGLTHTTAVVTTTTEVRSDSTAVASAAVTDVAGTAAASAGEAASEDTHKSSAWSVIVSSKALLVQSSEKDFASLCLSETENQSVQHSRKTRIFTRIPALVWGNKQGLSALIQGFSLDELPVKDSVAGLFLFAAERISIATLQTLPFDIDHSLERLSKQYPYFIYGDSSACYETISCDDVLFERVILPLCVELIALLEDDESQIYAQCLVDLLLASNRVKRACWALLALFDQTEVKRFISHNALFLLLSLSPEMLTLMGESVCAVALDAVSFTKEHTFVKESFPAQEHTLAKQTLDSAACFACVVNRQKEDLARLWELCCTSEQLSWEERCSYAAFVLSSNQVFEKQQANISNDEMLFFSPVPAGALCSPEFCQTILQSLQDLLQRVHESSNSILSWQNGLQKEWQNTREYQHFLAVLVVACWGVRENAFKLNDAETEVLSDCFTRATAVRLPAAVQKDITQVLRCLDLCQTEHKQHEQQISMVQNKPSSWNYHVVPIPRLRVNLWGCFSVCIGSRMLDARSFKRKKSIILLAILAAEKGSGFNRDYLVELLWPESTLSCARRNFHAVWSDLRHGLRLDDGTCPYLIRSGASYRLDAALVDCDAQEAEALCGCLRDSSCTQEQWDKAFLQITQHFSGEMLPDAPENQRIMHYSCATVEQINDALMSAAQTLFSRGSFALALRYAKEVIRRSPEREDACELVMQAQISLGQSVSALNTFFACQRFLSEQLGVSPSPAIYSLYERALGVSK